jgi:hypothetical protein
MDGIVGLRLGVLTLVRKGLYIAADSGFRISKYIETPWAIPCELQRWPILEPINKPNLSNTAFTDNYVRKTLTTEYFPD